MQYLIALAFFGFSGLMAYLSLRQKKQAASISAMKEIPLKEAKAGDVGIFKGEVQGTEVKLPYVDAPVAYFEYQLDEEIIKEENGRKRRIWKRVKEGKSRQPILVADADKAILVNPTKFAMQPLKLYEGKAVGLNKDIFEAIQFIAEGGLRPDLMTKTLKLRLFGLPIGQQAMVAAELEEENGALSAKRGEKGSAFAPTHDTNSLVKKEKMLIWVFAALAMIFALLAIFGLFGVISP